MVKRFKKLVALGLVFGTITAQTVTATAYDVGTYEVTAEDLNGDGIPDVEQDADGNGIPDFIDADRIAEEQRLAEEARKAEEERLAEEQRIAEEERLAQEEADRLAQEEAEKNQNQQENVDDNTESDGDEKPGEVPETGDDEGDESLKEDDQPGSETEEENDSDDGKDDNNDGEPSNGGDDSENENGDVGDQQPGDDQLGDDQESNEQKPDQEPEDSDESDSVSTPSDDGNSDNGEDMEQVEEPSDDAITEGVVEEVIPEVVEETEVSDGGEVNYVPNEYVRHKYSQDLTTEKFIAVVAESARQVGQERGLFASVMIAQAVLESGSGNSELASAPYFNLFGIKGAYNNEETGEQTSVSMWTQEDDGTGNLYSVQAAFRDYPSYKESFEDYADLLTTGPFQRHYSGATKVEGRTWDQAAQALEGTYATDVNYAEKIMDIVETYELTRYDEPLKYKNVDETVDTMAILSEVASHLGSDYVWGGTGPENFDCSGLVQYCYGKNGVALPRVAEAQGACGTEVSFDDLRPGDLLFFQYENGYVHHVAIYVGNGFYIHAPKTGDVVKVTGMDEYTPTFARRVIETRDLTPEEIAAQIQ